MTRQGAPAAEAESDAVPSLIVRRWIRAAPERLFAAWTDPTLLVHWWGPRDVTCIGAEVDLRVGGAYRLANRLPDGAVLYIAGEFERIAPPHELVYTWRLESVPNPVERVTVRFTPRDGGTDVIVVHDRVRDPALREQHAAGWEGCLEGLAELMA
jgi:uncharacterized protein YndB with AHSA1/START domain